MTQLVWFKRDLRVRDHLPLVEAARAGKVLPVYVVEPDLQRQPDYAARHWEFTRECLAELRQNLAALGAPLVVRVGGVTDVFTELHRRYSVVAIWSHQETGNDWTFRRDRAVASWARAQGIPWTEFPQFGVVRGLRSRDGWSRRWETFMRRPVAPTPEAIRGTTGIDPGVIPDSLQLRFAAEPGSHRQEGGTSAGLERLNGFLESRGVAYHREMSSPLTAEHSCSRLSAHLAAGTLSMREVAQATWRRRDSVMAQRRPERRGQGAALRAFIGRLHWHCHFIQKLEDAPEHEFRNIHRGYDGMRESEFDLGRFRAWAAGETGFPLVDACMRYLGDTGWLNFRMRAMLMAFSSYHLWLHWRRPGLHLARLFTDYEPGIHWSQVQMQSGTTGINALRVYNPVKQSRDQDPDGTFIRRWVPELEQVPDAFVHEPWRMGGLAQRKAGCRLGSDYPFPIVDHMSAAREARRRIQAVRQTAAFAEEAEYIRLRHGSRKGRRPRRTSEDEDGRVMEACP